MKSCPLTSKKESAIIQMQGITVEVAIAVLPVWMETSIFP
jgi:hypothetical protein